MGKKPGAKPDHDETDPTGADDVEKTKKGQVDPDDQPDPTEDEGDDEGADDFADPVKAKAEIKRLRDEAKKHRLKSKGLESELSGVKATLGSLKKALGGEQDEVDPVEALRTVQQQKEQLEVELSISQLERDNDIPKEQSEFFRFLLGKSMNELEEGEELDQDAIDAIKAKLPSTGGSTSSTGLGSKKPGAKPPAAGGTTITVEAFAKMTAAQKSELYTKDAATYNRLFSEARDKGFFN
jgi:hypothetical protein